MAVTSAHVNMYMDLVADVAGFMSHWLGEIREPGLARTTAAQFLPASPSHVNGGRGEIMATTAIDVSYRTGPLTVSVGREFPVACNLQTILPGPVPGLISRLLGRPRTAAAKDGMGMSR